MSIDKRHISDVEISNVEVRIGTPCTLSCSVTGLTDTVTITWSGYNDPGQIQEIDVALENGKQTKKLVLSPSEVFVDKTFTCSISSFSGSAGIQEEHAKLDVYSKTEFILSIYHHVDIKINFYFSYVYFLYFLSFLY